ncbi:hypothetical protein [Planococcus sp. YIM B11945]|uniref:hypothetical protein n=1 Tax=Planococcus sp. YIM B11945 TaxID=3435410 RepID=UPI003D7D9E50
MEDIKKEIEEAKESLWNMIVNGSDQEKINNCRYYISYLEEDYKQQSHLNF